MRNATPAFKRALVADKRDYTLRAVITLSDNTVLNLDNEDIWEDGMKIDDAVSADNLFEVGGAIVNQGTLVINNIYDDYSAYDFTDAHVVMYVGLTDLDDDTSDELRMGTFTVDEATYDGSIITLRCLDNMSKFDRAYTFEKPTDNEIIYPATLYNIVSNACHNCGVSLATNSLNFPHKDYVVTNMPSGESTTYRQVISWAAQIAVCFARCNALGELELKWYNTSAISDVSSLDGGEFDAGTPTYETGDDADGGSFSPWNTGYVYDAGSFAGYPGVDYITSSYSSNVSTDNVVITGITVRKKVQTESSSSAYIEYTSGSAGYTVIVDGNDFIDGSHGQDVANWMGTALIGMSFRKADITHPSDPTIEAGDVGLFIDFRGNMYPIVISSTSFSCNSSQRTVSSAETPAKNSQQRFTESTRNYVELRKQQVNDFNALAQRIAESGGLYETDVTVSGATQRWLHDKPNLADSEIVIAFTTVGITVCNDYHTKTSMVPPQEPTWYGLTVDGQLIASILNANGVNADWINTGAFTVRDANGNITFQADADTGAVTIKATDVPRQYFGSGTPTASNYPANQWTTTNLKDFHLGDLYTDTGSKKVYRYTYQSGDGYGWVEVVGTDADAVIGEMTQQQVFNKLTNNGTVQGLFLENGNLYMSFEFAHGGTLLLGGLNNQNGVLEVRNSSNQKVGTLDNNGLCIENSEYRVVLNNGYLNFYRESNGSWIQTGLIDTSYDGINDESINISSLYDLYIESYSNSANHPCIYMDDTHIEVTDLYSQGNLVVNSDAAVYGSLVVTGVAAFYSTLGVQASLSVGQSVSCGNLIAGGTFQLTGDMDSSGNLDVGEINCTDLFVLGFGYKDKIVKTQNYGMRGHTAYETATPYFGDMGMGTVGGNGEVIIDIDDVFLETVSDTVEYLVFLQKEGPGDIWVAEKEYNYFVVKGVPGTRFAWEIKATQKKLETSRLEDYADLKGRNIKDDDVGLSMENDLAFLDNEILFDE